MPAITVSEVNDWITANVLDSTAWDKATKQAVSVTQAKRNLERWYPDNKLTVDILSYQAIWELQGIDPALKFQKQGVKQVMEGREQIHYDHREPIAPDVRELWGSSSASGDVQYGGELI